MLWLFLSLWVLGSFVIAAAFGRIIRSGRRIAGVVAVELAPRPPPLPPPPRPSDQALLQVQLSQAGYYLGLALREGPCLEARA